MKYLMLLSALLGGTGLYVHQEQPQVWNQAVAQVTAAMTSMKASGATATATSFFAPAPTVAFTPPDPLPAHPNWVWSTSSGKTYRGVVVKKVEADCVTILDDDGGARIDIADLPTDVRQQLNYDPEIAARASEQRSKDEQDSAIALSEERAQSQEVQQAKLAQLDENRKQAEGGGDSSAVYDSAGADSGVSSHVSEGYYGASYGYYQGDMVFVREHLRIDPRTGRVEGDPFYMRKYYEDQRAIEHFQHLGAASRVSQGGSTLSNNPNTSWGQPKPGSVYRPSTPVTQGVVTTPETPTRAVIETRTTSQVRSSPPARYSSGGAANYSPHY